MSKKQLDKEAYAKFFTDVNKAMTEKTKGKVTLAMILQRNNVELDLPADIMEKIKPGLEVDLNAPIEVKKNGCANCAVCALCTLCAEANALSGLGGLVGAAGLNS
jgi:hypothetical protein